MYPESFPIGPAVVRKLANMRLSLMVTMDDHDKLFEELREQLKAGGCTRLLEEMAVEGIIDAEKRPGIIYDERPGGIKWEYFWKERKMGMQHRGTTTLFKLLGCGQEHEFAEIISSSCCHLDADKKRKKRFPAKVPRLECLAARVVGERQLSMLPPASSWFVVRHKPIP